MKILYITLENLSLQKGSVVHVKEIIHELRKLGHRIGLIASALDRIEMANQFYNLHHSIFLDLNHMGSRKPSYIFAAISLFFRLLKVLPHYDVIYARDYHTVLIALLPRLIFKKKLVFEINGLASEEQKLRGESWLNRVLSFFIQKAEILAAKSSQRIVSVTPQIATHLILRFRCAPEKVEVIGNGVNTKDFRPIRDKVLLSEWREKLGIAEDEAVVAFVGNLAPWQGVEYLIGAAPILLRNKKGIRFLIIGDGILKDELMAKANSLGISNHFVFTGMVEHEKIPLYINIADICVLPKRRLKSGYSPIKVYEYMACGKPVVASRVEGLAFLEEEGAGRLVEPEDVNDLEKALGDLLQDPGKRAAMGSTGLKIAREKYSWKSKVAEIERILKDLV